MHCWLLLQIYLCYLRLVLWSRVTFMHLVDAFIQSALHCIQYIVFNQFMHLLGIKRMTSALLVPYILLFELYRILNFLFSILFEHILLYCASRACLLAEHTVQLVWVCVWSGRGNDCKHKQISLGLSAHKRSDLSSLFLPVCTYTHAPSCFCFWGSELTRSQIKVTSQLPHQHYLQWFYTLCRL